MKTKLPLLAVAALAALSVSSANAALTLIYATNFNSPTYADGALIGQDGWAITGTTTTNPIVVANTATNGTVSLANTGQDVNRPFTPASTGGSVYVSASLTVGTAGAGDYFLHLGDGGSSNFNARLYARSSGTGYVLALGTGSGVPTYGTTVLPFDTPTNILFRYDFVGGASNDTGAVYVNPTTEDGSGDTPYVLATTTGNDAVSISSINLRQGGGGIAPTVTLDNIVVSVPEPGSALLGAIGLLGLLRRRRR